MSDVRIVDISGPDTFRLIPPCADPRFDHRTCDYWEDANRGQKVSRPSWLEVRAPNPAPAAAQSDNPFAPPARDEDPNPFAPAPRSAVADPFEAADDLFAVPADNPFAPVVARERPLREGVPRKLALLDRGRGIFGSYAKVLLAGDEAVAYCQFGPLSAYPRASRLRELYPQLPDAPLPAVVTCIATTADARGSGHARALVEEVCRDLTERGFSAVEAYPDLTLSEDESSGARPAFWHGLGFVTAVDDERYPVMRREL
ncbi:MAG TPA: GNAT family N-acetyltransferase [Candidatus Limnocylindrales bacterium]|nr:GNAT family N-acetyltransferase [Candidatus Limnocylindrales bacterium]